MKSKLLVAFVLVLTLLNVTSLLYGYSNAQQVSSLQTAVNDLPKEPVVYVGKDGYTPRKGIDYNDGDSGADGINAISFNTTIVKEVPLMGLAGKDGADGQDAPYQQIRVNSETQDIQTKQSNWAFWATLVYCQDYRLVCPDAN